jgi:hypothetical protein
MADIIYRYPFDPTGLRIDNQILKERHAISPPAWKDYHFIIPKLAPFYRDSLTVKELTTNRLLVEGVDWVATHRFIDASRAVAKPIYGSITFYDKTFSGIVEINYQTIGGDWTIDDALISQLLTQVSVNPRITTWEEIVNLPFQFPVIDHEWNLRDLIGLSEVKTALEGISQVIVDTGDIRPALQLHLTNLGNPHQVSKTQVGLSSVENFPVATRADALDGISDNTYMTPRRTRQAIEKVGYEYTNLHSNLTDNPHQVNKDQVGLGNVQNFTIATIGEAQDGDSHEKYMTPLRVKDAITSQATNRILSHTASFDNPHQVTKTQIGLSAVQNYPPATVSEAEAGTRDDRYMSPVRVRQAITRFANSYTDTVVQNFYTKAEVLDLIQTALTSSLQEYQEFNTHVNTVNSHEVTLAQLGIPSVSGALFANIQTVTNTASVQLSLL